MSAPWRILGVDNGTTHIGICVMEYNLEYQVATVIDLITLSPKERAYSRYPHLVYSRGNNHTRRIWLRYKFAELLRELDPEVVAIETPFIGGRATMSSFAPLTLSLQGLIDEVHEYADEEDISIYVEEVSPREAKTAVTLPSDEYNDDKAVLKDNILKHPRIDCSRFDLDTISLDAIDAIAVAYTAVTRLANF